MRPPGDTPAVFFVLTGAPIVTAKERLEAFDAKFDEARYQTDAEYARLVDAELEVLTQERLTESESELPEWWNDPKFWEEYRKKCAPFTEMMNRTQPVYGRRDGGTIVNQPGLLITTARGWKPWFVKNGTMMSFGALNLGVVVYYGYWW